MQINPILGHFLLKHDAKPSSNRYFKYEINNKNGIKLLIDIREDDTIYFESHFDSKWVTWGTNLFVTPSLIRILEIALETIIGSTISKDKLMTYEELMELITTKKIIVFENNLNTIVKIYVLKQNEGSINFYRAHKSILKIIRNEQKYFL